MKFIYLPSSDDDPAIISKKFSIYLSMLFSSFITKLFYSSIEGKTIYSYGLFWLLTPDNEDLIICSSTGGIKSKGARDVNW